MYPDANFLVLGGPPCQDVSQLGNRAGAWGSRSCYRESFRRVFNLFKQAVASEDKLFGLMECTTMSKDDRIEYDKVFGAPPFEVCASSFQCMTRRLVLDGGGSASSLVSKTTLSLHPASTTRSSKSSQTRPGPPRKNQFCLVGFRGLSIIRTTSLCFAA